MPTTFRKTCASRGGATPQGTTSQGADPKFQELLDAPAPTTKQIKDYLNGLFYSSANAILYQTQLDFTRWKPVLKKLLQNRNIEAVNAYLINVIYKLNFNEFVKLTKMYREYDPAEFFKRNPLQMYQMKRRIKNEYEDLYPDWEPFIVSCFKKTRYLPFLKGLIQNRWFIHPIVFFKYITRVENKTLQKSLVNLYFETIHYRAPAPPDPPGENAEDDEWDEYDDAMYMFEVYHYNPYTDYRFVHKYSFVKLLLEYIETERKKPAKQRTEIYNNFLKRMIDSIDERDLADLLNTDKSQKTVFENLAHLTVYSQTKMAQSVWEILDKTFHRETYAYFVVNGFVVFIETEKMEPEMQDVQEKLLLKLLKEKTEETVQTLRIPFIEEQEEMPEVSVLGYAFIHKNIRAIAFLLNLGATIDEQDNEYVSAPEFQRLINLPKFTSTIQEYYREHYYKFSHRSQAKRTAAFNEHLEEFKSAIKHSARSRQSPRSPEARSRQSPRSPTEIHLSLHGGGRFPIKPSKKPKRF
jgi:hypothetical protein